MQPLLSIIVPTKDRYFYLKYLIRLIDSFRSNYIELVIQDNTEDNTEIVQFIEENNFSNLKYFHTEKQLPIFYNSDLAILNSTGEYVCFIGDDDGVTRHIVDCVKWMKKEEIDVVVSTFLHYRWPDFIVKNKSDAGILKSVKFSKKSKEVDSHSVLSKSFNKGFIDRGELPLLYHGIVKRTTLNEIYSIGGTFNPGASPDIACGVALCFFAKKYVRIDFPIIISGAGKGHGGGILKSRESKTRIEDLPFLPKDAKKNWEENIPSVWTGETVWPESAIKALRYVGQYNLMRFFNQEYMLAKFIIQNFYLREKAWHLSKNKLKMFAYLFFLGVSKSFKGIMFRFKKLCPFLFLQKNIVKLNNIIEVENHIIEVYPIFHIQKKK